ncbi:MAG: hypothetical protein GKR94_12825 [Gammaproteobacteria bacterium]|nr:hypothetical protein [Gammaproteobacteria bacterium]
MGRVLCGIAFAGAARGLARPRCERRPVARSPGRAILSRRLPLLLLSAAVHRLRRASVVCAVARIESGCLGRSVHRRTGKPARRLRDFTYRTGQSWSHRVVGKAESLSEGENPRFVVTHLSPRQASAKRLYEKLYCARGERDNRIKEQPLDLFADRTSAHTMRANPLRLYFSSFAYVLMQV